MYNLRLETKYEQHGSKLTVEYKFVDKSCPDRIFDYHRVEGPVETVVSTLIEQHFYTANALSVINGKHADLFNLSFKLNNDRKKAVTERLDKNDVKKLQDLVNSNFVDLRSESDAEELPNSPSPKSSVSPPLSQKLSSGEYITKSQSLEEIYVDEINNNVIVDNIVDVEAARNKEAIDFRTQIAEDEYCLYPAITRKLITHVQTADENERKSKGFKIDMLTVDQIRERLQLVDDTGFIYFTNVDAILEIKHLNDEMKSKTSLTPKQQIEQSRALKLKQSPEPVKILRNGAMVTKTEPRGLKRKNTPTLNAEESPFKRLRKQTLIGDTLKKTPVWKEIPGSQAEEIELFNEDE